MVRFVNGAPSAIYLSAHSGGSAYTFNATQKTNGRPTTYIGVGTHANYAKSGKHCHDLPADLLCDQTDSGALWDPVANYRAFWFDNSTQTFSIAGGAGVGAANLEAEGTGWLSYKGKWGDEQYPVLEHGQYCLEIGSLVDECKYTTGPTGEYRVCTLSPSASTRSCLVLLTRVVMARSYREEPWTKRCLPEGEQLQDLDVTLTYLRR